jgi:SAM-dependent methyltransferase
VDIETAKDDRTEQLAAYCRDSALSELGDFGGLLDHAYAEIQAGRVAEGLGVLYLGLYGHRRSMAEAEWQRLALRARSEHELRRLIYQSPFTARAYKKPRGYAGDAELIDFIYGYGNSPVGLTELGADIYQWERRSPGCRSVRGRRDLVSQTIDFLPTITRRPRVMSIACGHLREALTSCSIREGQLAEVVAVDQDEQSLRVVAQYALPGIQIQHRSVKDILLNRHAYKDFDLVYAAGLYDYLTDNIARALTSAIFRMLRPGGRCLIANFAPDMIDIGYMDAFMDWRLIYRTEDQVAALTDGIPDGEVFARRLFREAEGCIVFCETVRG